jgi:2-desacetyl-2-hydroxyethyl bacteriochlorophyllide A dehydrogenase
VRLKAPGKGEVLVETLYSGISRGTESLVFTGAVPKSQYEAMRAPFQEGAFPYPVKYGYASVGKIQAGPAELKGRCVFCLYPHQSAYVVPSEAVVPLPEALPPERAVLAANMETAINGLWDAGLRIGDRVAVVGGGTVGCLIGALAQALPGSEVALVDVDPAKREVAERLGLGFCSPEAAPKECDVVFHASGSGAGLTTALGLAGFEGTIVEMSWFGNAQVSLPLGEAFHARRLRLISSQVGAVASSRRARWTHRRRLEFGLRLLRDARFDALVTGESAFEDLPRALETIAEDGRGVLCHRVRYGTDEGV